MLSGSWRCSLSSTNVTLHTPFHGGGAEDLADAAGHFSVWASAFIERMLPDDVAQDGLCEESDRWAALTVSMTTTDLRASVDTEEGNRGNVRHSLFSGLMIPCDWIGMVAMRSKPRESVDDRDDES